MRVYLFCLCLCIPFWGEAKRIFETLEASQEGEGEILIYQSEEISQRVGENATNEKKFSNYTTAKGFRIQVYSDNKQLASRNEALSREEKVKEEFPDLPTYVTFVSPFWKLRVGDFSSYEEANSMLRKMRLKLGDIGKEMYIVKETIRISAN